MDAKLIPAVLPVLTANAVTVWLLASGRMSMFELLLLLTLELVGLQLVDCASDTWGRHSRRKRRRFPVGLWGVLLRTLAMAGLAALLWPFQLMQMWLFGGIENWQQLLDPLRTIAGSAVKWPLLITLAGAVWDATSGKDDRNQQQLAGRLLILVLGGFPFLAPLLLAGGATVREVLRARTDQAGLRLEPRLIVFGTATVVLLFGGMSLLPWLFSLGPIGWIMSFLSTKILLELTAAVAQKGGGRKRKRGNKCEK